MSNYTLSEGQSVIIRTDSNVDDFVYEGGLIKVPPTIAFRRQGSFIFRPTSSEDPWGQVVGVLASRLSTECGSNGILPGFRIYDTYPDTTALFFPCLVLDQGGTGQVGTSFFGGDFMERQNIICDLAFKRGTRIQLDDTDSQGNFILLTDDALAEHLLYEVDKALNDIVYDSDIIKVGDIRIDSRIQIPQVPNQTLYGFAMDIYVEIEQRQLI